MLCNNTKSMFILFFIMDLYSSSVAQFRSRRTISISINSNVFGSCTVVHVGFDTGHISKNIKMH